MNDESVKELRKPVKPIRYQSDVDMKCMEIVGLSNEARPDPTKILQAAIELANGLWAAENQKLLEQQRKLVAAEARIDVAAGIFDEILALGESTRMTGEQILMAFNAAKDLARSWSHRDSMPRKEPWTQEQKEALARLMDTAQHLLRSTKLCGACGGKLVAILGKNPREPDCEVCPTCTTERVEAPGTASVAGETCEVLVMGDADKEICGLPMPCRLHDRRVG